MTRFPDDPEVLADLRAREASEGDRSRTRPDGWTPPAIVERWPCTGCSALVGVTREIVDLHAMFNRQLERRRDRPLPKRIPCDACVAKRTAEEQRQIPLDNERPTTAGKGRP